MGFEYQETNDNVKRNKKNNVIIPDKKNKKMNVSEVSKREKTYPNTFKAC